MKTAEQLQLRMLRRTGVTAREAVALAGLNHQFATIHEIYEAKVNDKPLPEEPDSDVRMLAAFYKKETGALLEPYGVVRHATRRFAIADPGWAVVGKVPTSKAGTPPRTIEVMASAQRLVRFVSAVKSKFWGPPGGQIVPPVLFAECQWDLAVTGQEELDVVARFVGGGQTVYTLKVLADLFDGYYAIAEHFMSNYAMPACPPPTEAEMMAALEEQRAAAKAVKTDA